MKVYEFIKEIYPLSWDYGFTAVMWNEWYFWAINDWLNYIYMSWGTPKNWQIKTEAMYSDNNWKLFWVTNFPVTLVNNFWCWDSMECIKSVDFANRTCCAWDNSYCETCATMCDCTERICWRWLVANTIPNMIPVSPWASLVPSTYKISWWANWLGWSFWNYIEAKLPQSHCTWCASCQTVYITYVWWFKRLKNIDDTIPLPDAYITALKFLVMSFIVSRYITFRANDDSWYLELARDMLDSLNKLQVNIPSFIKAK